MALLPGVPDMGPKPVSPTIAISGKSSLGGPSGIAKVAQGAGKPGNTEHFGSVVGRTGKGISNLGGGSSLAHSQSQYAKTPGPGAIMGGEGAAGIDPTAHSGSKMIRGESGAMRSHIREGGLGPGPMSAPGQSDTNYSQSSGDAE
jgi:hypothetical protein